MRKRALLVLGILAFMVLFGYFAEPASDPELTGETPDIREQIETSDEDCYTDPTKGDPAPTYCLLEEEPPDIRVENWHDERHNVTLQIVKDSTVTYSTNVTLDAATDGVNRLTLLNVIRTQETTRYVARLTASGAIRTTRRSKRCISGTAVRSGKSRSTRTASWPYGT